MELLDRFQDGDSSYPGFEYIRKPIDKFQLEDSAKKNTRIVYETLRETLLRFQNRMPRQRLPPPLFKGYLFILLQALDYLHTQCRLIHTGRFHSILCTKHFCFVNVEIQDLKDDNIMVTIEDESLLKAFAKYHQQHAAPRHVNESGRITYLSQDEFGPFRSSQLIPQIVDFNLCFPGLPDRRGHPSAIQPHRYRAPEVFLGCSWSYSADIWNLGVLVCELVYHFGQF